MVPWYLIGWWWWAYEIHGVNPKFPLLLKYDLQKQSSWYLTHHHECETRVLRSRRVNTRFSLSIWSPTICKSNPLLLSLSLWPMRFIILKNISLTYRIIIYYLKTIFLKKKLRSVVFFFNYIMGTWIFAFGDIDCWPFREMRHLFL